jgi:hypothetical protein
VGEAKPIKIIRPEDIPDADTVIVGVPYRVRPTYQKKECVRCHGEVWITEKNAQRKVEFICLPCARNALADELVGQGLALATTEEDIEQTAKEIGIQGWDKEAIMNRFKYLINKYLGRDK